MKDFEIIDSKERISIDDAEMQYRGCNYLMINAEYDNDSGMVYAVSRTPLTLSKLVKLENEFTDKGIETFIGGEYNPSAVSYMDIISMKQVNI